MTKLILQEQSEGAAAFRGAVPSIHFRKGALTRLKVVQEESVEDLRRKLFAHPRALLSLFEQSSYMHMFGPDCRLVTELFCETEDFEGLTSILPQLFQSAVSSKARVASASGYHVALKGLTQRGNEVLEYMRDCGCVPKELERLYGPPFQIDQTSKPALYLLRGGQASSQYEESAFLRAILTDEQVTSMDVSGLSLEQCGMESLIQHLVDTRPTVYLWIDVLPHTEIRLKRLRWT